MARPKSRSTMRSMQSYNDKMKRAGVKVKNLKAKQTNLQGGAKNRNQAYTSGGANNQGYDYEAKQFTKGSSRSATGRLAIEGETNAANARTWAMTVKDENGNTVRQSGRSQTAKRAERYYDRRKGYYDNYRQTDAGKQTMAQMKQGGVNRSLGFTIG